MRIRWKRVFFWSSLGSVAVALAVSVARKTRKPSPAVTEFQPVPPDCTGLTIRTQAFEVEQAGVPAAVWDEYTVQPTAFKVWNVLELQPEPAGSNVQGTAIYHISHVRRKQHAPEAQDLELVERFYGTLRSVEPGSRAPRKNELARGAFLEVPRCYVGGSANGVETGEVHRSSAPIRDFTFQLS